MSRVEQGVDLAPGPRQYAGLDPSWSIIQVAVPAASCTLATRL